MKNGTIKIERGIPIPLRTGKSKGYTSVLRKLKVGESVVLPTTTQTVNALAEQIRVCKSCPLPNHRYTGRKLDNDHTRVWRIK